MRQWLKTRLVVAPEPAGEPHAKALRCPTVGVACTAVNHPALQKETATPGSMGFCGEHKAEAVRSGVGAGLHQKPRRLPMKLSRS
jgi:hypothetical protein